MKITCALFVLALASYANAATTITKCSSDLTPGSGGCLDPTSTTTGACPAAAVDCVDTASPALIQCKSVVTLENWVAKSVIRTCVEAGTGAAGCTASPGTAADGTQTVCQSGTAVADNLSGKGPLKCFKCTNCAAAQSPGTSEDGSWSAPAGYKLCWIKATFAAGVLGQVDRDGSATTAPAGTPYNTGTATGDVVTSCDDAMLCNIAAGSAIAPALKCQGDDTADSGACLNPAATTGCATAVNCAVATPQCKITVKLENWVAKSVARTCVAAGTVASGCTAANAATATGDQIVCEMGTTTDVTNKGPLKCYECTTCTAAQTAGTNEVGGWSAAAGCKECWIKANYANGTLGAVDRGCTTNTAAAPTENYNNVTRTGVVVTKCAATALCNSGAGSTLVQPPAAPGGPGGPGGPPAPTTTPALGTTTGAGGSGASTIAPATFAMFFVSMIIMKMFA